MGTAVSSGRTIRAIYWLVEIFRKESMEFNPFVRLRTGVWERGGSEKEAKFVRGSLETMTTE